MSTRTKLLGRINNKGHYTCIFCTIKDGKFLFDIGKQGGYSWDRYASNIGSTACLNIDNLDTGTFEIRNLNLTTGEDCVWISFKGEKPIAADSFDIYNDFQQWIKRSDVVAVTKGDGTEYVPVKAYRERETRESGVQSNI